MNGLATRNMLKQIADLAPEVEAPRDDAFGLDAIKAEQRRDKIERGWALTYKVGMWGVMLAAAVAIGYHSKMPEKPFALASGSLARTCTIDSKENCLVCSFTDAEGRERHRNVHCPALAPGGMMAWPVEGK